MLGFTSVVWSWAFYDLANTVFSALFVSFTFGMLIRTHLGGTDLMIGATMGLACLLAAMVVPFLGSITDQTGRRLPVLFCLTVLCCVATPMAAYFPLAVAIPISGVAIFAYYTGLAIYDSILPEIAAAHEQGRVSGLGVGVGYAGTILGLLCTLPLAAIFGGDSIQYIRAVGWLIGIMFFTFALPLFFVHKERGTGVSVRFGQAAAKSIGRVMEGARHAGRDLWIFIACSFFIVNAVMAVIGFFNLFGRIQLGMSVNEVVQVYMALAVAAMIGGLVAGRLVDRFGPWPVLMASVLMWIGVVLFMMVIDTKTGFIIAGIVGGVAIGWVWTSQRPLLVRLGDPERMGETFGFLGIANRASAVVGPFVFGYFSTRFAAEEGGSNYNAGLASLLVFFGIGLVLLLFVPRPPPMRPGN